MTNKDVQHVFFVLDLRSTSSHEDLITTNEGQALANKLRLSFCETSGLKKAGVKECFEAAVIMKLSSKMKFIFKKSFGFVSVLLKLHLFTPGKMHGGQSNGGKKGWF